MPGIKLLQLFFHWVSSAFVDFKESIMHLNQEMMNFFLRYLLGRFVEVIKMKETAVLLDMEVVKRTNCPGA